MRRGLLGLALLLPAAASAAAERTLVIERFDAVIDVSPDGSIVVEETIMPRFTGTWNGIRRFLRIALGSASELEYHFLLAHDLGLLPKSAYERLTAATSEVKRMLTGLAGRLSERLELRADS